ncbi:KIN14I [Symbiodinium pilosum]|uniref:KIN14I protein n=1 Tax=Symbiodinium pilosum TaxID=2952 RepID=A0A812IQ37_SYMPI|nr:KIN14I [Symbiodinium pilosum]
MNLTDFLKQLNSKVDSLSAQLTQLEARFMEEQLIRKKYHNQIQDMKGTIRVFCRFRPLGKREQENGDVTVLHKADAFSVDLQRGAPHNDSRRFEFDAVFGSDSSQEEVFGDCRGLRKVPTSSA